MSILCLMVFKYMNLEKWDDVLKVVNAFCLEGGPLPHSYTQRSGIMPRHATTM